MSAPVDTEQNAVDQVCYYRNLAIRLGAKPEDMVNAFDRSVCETWDSCTHDGETATESIDRQRREWAEQWEDNERLLARFAAAVRLVFPEHLTPQGKRVLESIIEEEQERAS